MATNDLEYQLQLKLDGIDKTLQGLSSQMVESGKKIGGETGDGIVKTLNERLKVLEASSQKAKLALETISQARVKIRVDTDLVNIRIKEVEARLASLRLKDSSPKIDIQIEKEVNKIANLQSQIQKLKVSEIRLDIKEENSAKIFSNLELKTNNLKGRISSVLAEELAKSSSVGKKQGLQTGQDIADGIDKGVGNLKMGDIIKANLASAFTFEGIKQGLSVIKDFTQGAVDEFGQVKKAFTTLEIISPRFGQDAEKAKQAAQSLAKELKLGVGTTAEGLQNLFKSGLNLDQASDLLRRFNNEAITGKSASISLDDAVKNLSFAYNTQNSALGNMSGVSENFSDIQEKGLLVLQKQGKYLGLSVAKLDEAGKKEAQYAGIIELTNLTLGSSAKFQGTYIDNLQKLQQETLNTKVAIGEKLEPVFNQLVLAILPAVSALSEFIIKADFGTLQQFIPIIAGVGGALTLAMIPAITAGVVAIGGFALAAIPFILAGTAIAGVAYLIQQNWGAITPILDGVKNTVLDFGNTLKNSFGEIQNIFNTGGGNTDNTTKLLKSLGISDDLSLKITTTLTGVIGNAKGSFDELQQTFNGQVVGTDNTQNIFKSLGLSDDASAQVTGRIRQITANIKPAFAELQTSLSGNAGGSNKGLANLLGINEQQANIINNTIATISTTIQNLPATLGTAFNTVKQFFVDTFNNPIVQAGINSIVTSFTTLLLPAITNLGNTLSALFLPLLTQVFNYLGIILPPILTALGAILGAVLVVGINLLIGVFSGLVNSISFVVSAFSGIYAVVLAVFGTIVAYFSTIVQTIIAIFTGNFGALTGIWSGFLNNLKTLWGDAWNTIKASISGIWNTIVTNVTSGWNLLSAYLGIAFGLLKTFWTNGWNSIIANVSTAFETIKTGVSNGINAVIDFFKNLGGQIIAIVQGIDLGGVGRSLIQSMIDGIKSMAGAVASAINNVVSGVSGGLFKLPGFASGVSNFGGGPAMVGERGFEFLKTSKGLYLANQPTIANLPRGTDVYSNAQSRRMLGNNTTNSTNTRNSNNSISINNFNGSQSFNSFDTDALFNAI